MNRNGTLGISLYLKFVDYNVMLCSPREVSQMHYQWISLTL